MNICSYGFKSRPGYRTGDIREIVSRFLKAILMLKEFDQDVDDRNNINDYITQLKKLKKVSTY